MTYNLLTILFAVIVAGSIIFGLGRGLGREARHVVWQIVSICIALLSIWVAWVASRRIDQMILHQTSSAIAQWPHWLTAIILAWQKSPRVGNWIALIICYLILSSILNRLIASLLSHIPLWLPKPLQKSHLLGGLLGGAMGLVRSGVIGAIVFLALQYFSLPWLENLTNHSKPYQMLSNRVYQPSLQPLIQRELPVLADGALQPLAQNISLFAIPSGSNGQETGVLFVPKQISALSAKLTANRKDPKAKAKALYEWEIHHITYDWKKYDDYVYHGKWDSQSPLQTLQTGKGVCADYALLYADLAHAARLTVQIDEGMGGSGASLGSHAWNQIFLPSSQHWIMVDTTWGASQDAWFDVSKSTFDKTHIEQTSITIAATGKA